ncbi:hypothetical protein evm_009543 [Chilo suppressalis]|nr:hypothetical protein evm_009543 [Chilo suppressalis]
MFESDDFDQVLSQFEFPVAPSSNNEPEANKTSSHHNLEKVTEPPDKIKKSDYSQEPFNKLNVKDNISNSMMSPAPGNNSNVKENISDIIVPSNPVSPKHTKRKIIGSYFDHKSKRKFPGPAGMLTGVLEENTDAVVCQMELLSQDVDFTQNCLQKDAFDSPLWLRLQEDIKDWNLGSIDTTKAIKQTCISGSIRKRKAQTVAAFIESVDRSITDPLVTLRDSMGSIKCTLHRDAWSKFAPYIVSECSAIVLWKPTILTTGSAFKKYYLNITLSNIFAIYSSVVIDSDVNTALPDGYVKTYEGDFTVIKVNESSLHSGLSSIVPSPDENCLLDGLDNIFSDDIF